MIAILNAYLIGKRSGTVDAEDRKLRDAVHVQDSVTRSDSAKTDSAKKTSDILTTYRSHVREKVVTRRDTILVHDSVVAVSPEIAQLIQADDSTITALKNLVASQDTLIADLRSGLKLRDSRIKLLESERNPGKLKGILAATRWVALGALVGAAFVHR